MKIPWSSIISTTVTVSMVAASAWLLHAITIDYEPHGCLPVYETHSVLFIVALMYFLYHYDRG